MTSIRLTPGRGQRMAPPVRSGTLVQQLLLLCGILSSLIYLASDVLAGSRYPGYSFTSQTISELGAIGAPSEAFFGPMLLLYNALVLVFGVAVLREGLGRSRALRTVGSLLITYAAIGLVTVAMGVLGITYFQMDQRGLGSLPGDAPHIILTAVLVLLLLASMAVAAFAFGRQFRIYSFATLAAVVVFGALTARYADQLAAGQATPWLGVIERIDVYAAMLWLAVLAVVLLRRPASRSGGRVQAMPAPDVHGMVAPGFEEVRAEFERNLGERGEIGAAVAAYWRGEKVVDLWGGRRTPDGDEPWNEDTMVAVASTTKGLAALTLALANARGWLDYDAPVARYWPEFAQNGKGAITVRQLLGHQAGLVLLDEQVTVEKLRDLDYMARLLARQKPAWTPGTRHGYHTLTIGLYMQELMRRVDPEHRTIGRFFREEIARPLDLEFHIGLPRGVPDERIARLQPLSPWRGILALRYTPPAVTLKMIMPGSLLRRTFLGTNLDMNERRSLEIELPAGNGVGTARAIARAYSALAEGGAELGITPETFARMIEPPEVARSKDVVLGVPSYFSLGFLRPGPKVSFGSSPRALGSPGAGGSFGFADPDARLGYAYVMNRLDFYLENDPREKALRDAVYRGIARLSARTGVPAHTPPAGRLPVPAAEPVEAGAASAT